MTEDFIQQAVNNAYENSLNRWQKHINYSVQLSNRARKIRKVKRKIQRQNRRKARR